MIFMTGAGFESKVLDELFFLRKTMVSLKEEVDYLREEIEDAQLSEEEKKLVDQTLDDRKRNKLLSSKEIFG
ncbi:MAG: hypothetical protein ABH950_03990 [Candidatus Altiarchaeota archaeon]